MEKINHGYFVTKIQFQENREVGFCQLHAESSLALRIPNCGLQQAKMRGSSKPEDSLSHSGRLQSRQFGRVSAVCMYFSSNLPVICRLFAAISAYCSINSSFQKPVFKCVFLDFGIVKYTSSYILLYYFTQFFCSKYSKKQTNNTEEMNHEIKDIFYFSHFCKLIIYLSTKFNVKI